MELKEIKKIVELMKDNELTKFELEEEGFRIALARGPGDDIKMVSPHAMVQQTIPQAPAAYTPPPEAAAAPVAPDENAGLVDIVSPIVGTFYRSGSPEADPFVSVGQQVDKDTVVCIVEAMKVMNEIKADVSGTVVKILIENATPVMFGQAIFKVKPN